MKSTDTLTSAHIHIWEDSDGNAVEAEYFCSDYCHRNYVRIRGIRYEGWNGCHEVNAPQWCSNCGEEF